MDMPASRKKNLVKMLAPIIGGVCIFGVIAGFSHSVATAAALAAIGFAAVSMLLAVTRKH
jgi:uncharacterized membrane protein (Fun14 family)